MVESTEKLQQDSILNAGLLSRDLGEVSSGVDGLGWSIRDLHSYVGEVVDTAIDQRAEALVKFTKNKLEHLKDKLEERSSKRQQHQEEEPRRARSTNAGVVEALREEHQDLRAEMDGTLNTL